MFSNLKMILCKKEITIRQYAEFLGISEKSAHNKIKGHTDFTYQEYKKTCKMLLPEYNPDYLFREE